MTRLEWAHYCDWVYSTNQPLECFLNDPQPATGWNWIGWASLAVFLAIGAILDKYQK